MTPQPITDHFHHLRLGCIKYLNARPLIHGWPGKVAFDDPANLCQQLARGDLDVALVSSFEFLRNPTYRIVDAVSISSDGPVYSVVVAHLGKVSDIEEIDLDPASLTSVNLLRCLLAELAVKPCLIKRPAGVSSAAGRTRRGEPSGSKSGSSTDRVRLLIGDQAIRFRQQHENEYHFWDLGQAWKKLVDLPFVYALWLIRPENVDFKRIASRLRALRDQNLAQLDRIMAEEKEFSPAFCSRYYREHVRFSFGEREKGGLRSFAQLCAKHGLLPQRDLHLDLV